MIRRSARAVLTRAVRGRKERGGEWGEAVLAEFDQTVGDREALRWAAGGLRTVWLERRARVRELPKPVRIGRRVLRTLAAGLVLGFAVNQWVLSVGVVANGSMEPTLFITDRYLMDKTAFRLTGLRHNDVVVITLAAPTRTTVKRVIGLPGDTISCAGGRVLRDGVALDEPYLTGSPDDDQATQCDTVTVPPGRLYLLGDHRLVSQDSRQMGTYAESAVDARVVGSVSRFR